MKKWDYSTGRIERKSDHAVIVYFMYGKSDELEALFNLSTKLEKEITKKNVGVFDGHEINTDDSDGSVYMYGPNAAELFKAILPVLDSTDFMVGAIAQLQFGPPEEGVMVIEVRIGAN